MVENRSATWASWLSAAAAAMSAVAAVASCQVSELQNQATLAENEMRPHINWLNTEYNEDYSFEIRGNQHYVRSLFATMYLIAKGRVLNYNGNGYRVPHMNMAFFKREIEFATI